MTLPVTLDTSDPQAVYRFIGGRRHYNSWRKCMAAMRRREVMRLLLEGHSQAEIARRLHVHKSTISRDVKAIRAWARRECYCPVCGSKVR